MSSPKNGYDLALSIFRTAALVGGVAVIAVTYNHARAMPDPAAEIREAYFCGRSDGGYVVTLKLAPELIQKSTVEHICSKYQVFRDEMAKITRSGAR